MKIVKFKNVLIFSICLLFSLLFAYKVNAVNLGYCSFDDLKLTLPVTVGANVNGAEFNDMFSPNKLHDIYTKEIIDEESCKKGIKINYYTNKNGIKLFNKNNVTYMININYFYKYNDQIYPVNNVELNNGTYSNFDSTPPVITSTINPISANTEFKISLDTLISYIHVKDETDNNITPEIIYDGYSSNYNLPGNYAINYKACDKSNNCSNYTQRIVVKDLILPTIKGINSFDSYMSNPLTINEIISNLSANDNIDGDISKDIFLDNTNYNLKRPGIYYAYFNVKDSSNNYVKELFKVQINYKDDIIPTIEGPNSLNSYMSNPLNINTIINNLTSFDNVDQNINSNIYVIEDNFTINKYNLGTYQVIVNVLDNSNNESLPFVIEITNIDDIKPTINGDTTYTSSMSNPLSLLSIKNKLIVYDNIDGNINYNLEIVNDEYSDNYNKLGTFIVCFQVKDSSNNLSDIFKIEITTIDDILPTIEGISFYKTTTTNKINIDSVTDSLIVKDNVDTNIEYKLELNKDNYSDNFLNPGEYYLVYYVCDNSGNISLPFKIKIIVNQTMDFISSINNSFLYFNNDKLILENEILNILKVDTSKYKLNNIIENSYQNNYQTPGNYKIVYEFENTDYTKEYLTVNINVYTNNKNTNNGSNLIIDKKKKETIFSYIASFFNKIFNSFINLFK